VLAVTEEVCIGRREVVAVDGLGVDQQLLARDEAVAQDAQRGPRVAALHEPVG
jgi:hypothetical protein